MLKIIAPNSYYFGEPTLKHIKQSSAGLIGNDLLAFVKSAGAEAASRVRSLPAKSGEELVHMLALGATEAIGPNRNGDGFKEANCKKFHNTFVKYGRYYRDHKNKDPKKSYGLIKDSWYNDKMRRIELIVAWNATKEAAERNGGLVADKEIEKLNNDGENGVSMSCKVAYDVCSGCGNRSKTREDYCDEKTCIKYGGLKKNMARVFEDGHILHADNPEPCFFDISGVYRPADRIAYVMGKVASMGDKVISGAELAELAGLTLPTDIMMAVQNKSAFEQLSLLQKLSQLETELTSIELAGGVHYQGSIFSEHPPLFNSTKGRSLLKALCQEKIALSLPDFLRMLGASENSIQKFANDIASELPGIYGKIVNSVSADIDLENNPFRTTHIVASESSRRWASGLKSQYSITKQSMQKRAWQESLQNTKNSTSIVLTKAATSSQNKTSDVNEFFARQFALYKLALLADLKEQDEELGLTAGTLVLQNNTIREL